MYQGTVMSSAGLCGASKGMTKPAKKSAQDRTLDMFSQAVADARKAETDAGLAQLASEDATEAPRQAENIEQAAERWRANAFFTQEHLSKHFNQGEPGTAKFRITEKDGWSFLEQFRLGKDGLAYHWTGLMFKTSDTHELTNVLLKASKAIASSEDKNGPT